MEQLVNFLSSARDDIFKLLPMRELELKGVDNHINDYLDSLIVTFDGGTASYPVLAKEKQYLYVINNLRYLRLYNPEFGLWRKTVLNSTRFLDNLYKLYGGEEDA